MEKEISFMVFLPCCQVFVHHVTVILMSFFKLIFNYFRCHVSMFNTCYVATGSISCDSYEHRRQLDLHIFCYISALSVLLLSICSDSHASFMPV